MSKENIRSKETLQGIETFSSSVTLNSIADVGKKNWYLRLMAIRSIQATNIHEPKMQYGETLFSSHTESSSEYNIQFILKLQKNALQVHSGSLSHCFKSVRGNYFTAQNTFECMRL